MKGSKLYRILVINPGSTSTKIASYHGESCIFSESIHHNSDALYKYNSILEQLPFRSECIKELLLNKNIHLSDFDAFVGRGGLLRPIESGTFAINDNMISDLQNSERGEHASNLGALLAYEFAAERSRPSFIVDPVVVNEMQPAAKISGHPDFERKSIFHALNHKAVARKLAERIKKVYQESNFIIAHMGGGITIAAHEKGRVIDVNNGLDGEGPFSAERSGTLPAGDLIRACYSSGLPQSEMLKKVKGKGGLVAYFGTNDFCRLMKRYEKGDKNVELVIDAMAYQIAKGIAALGAPLKGSVDAIALTGGMSHSNTFVNRIRSHVQHISPVYIFPGEFEMEALAFGALRVLTGKEKAKVY